MLSIPETGVHTKYFKMYGLLRKKHHVHHLHVCNSTWMYHISTSPTWCLRYNPHKFIYHFIPVSVEDKILSLFYLTEFKFMRLTRFLQACFALRKWLTKCIRPFYKKRSNYHHHKKEHQWFSVARKKKNTNRSMPLSTMNCSKWAWEMRFEAKKSVLTSPIIFRKEEPTFKILKKEKGKRGRKSYIQLRRIKRSTSTSTLLNMQFIAWDLKPIHCKRRFKI